MISCFLHFLINGKGIEEWIHSNPAQLYTLPFTYALLTCVCVCVRPESFNNISHQSSHHFSVPCLLSQLAHSLHCLQLFCKVPLTLLFRDHCSCLCSMSLCHVGSPWSLTHVADGNMALCPYVLPGHTMRTLATSGCSLLLKLTCINTGRGMPQILYYLFVCSYVCVCTCGGQRSVSSTTPQVLYMYTLFWDVSYWPEIYRVS